MPIKIKLDKGQGPYSGGEIITGKVVVINNSRKTRQLNQDLSITFLGKAWTQWKESRNNRDDVRQCLVSKREEEIYFNQSVLLLQSGSSIATRAILPGVTEHPFMYQLPPNLPSSFHTKHGGVFYTVQVLYKRPWKCDKLVQVNIAVQGCYNLINYPNTSQPGYFTLAKKIWRGMGEIKASILLNQRGFLPGEQLHFKLELQNGTWLQLQRIRVYLVQLITYFAHTSIRHEVRKCAKVKCPLVKGNQSMNYPGCIIIPENLAPTNLGNCRLVQPRYCLLIKIQTAFVGKILFYSALEGRVPIVIGTPEMPSSRSIYFQRPTSTFSSNPTRMVTSQESEHGGNALNNNEEIITLSTALPSYEVAEQTHNMMMNEFSNAPSSSNGHLSTNNNNNNQITQLLSICPPINTWDNCDNDLPPTYEDVVALSPVLEKAHCKYKLATG